MNLPTIKVVFDRKKQASRTKKGLVQIEIYHNRVRKYISTGVKLFSNQWDETKRVINSDNSFEYNSIINRYVITISEGINKMMKENGYFSYDMLDVVLNSTKAPLIADFILDELERSGLAEGTTKHHRSLVERLEEFGRIISFKDATLSNIERLDDFLRDGKRSQVTIYGYHKQLKKWLTLAVKRGYLEKSPYANFKLNRGETAEREYLTEAELRTMRDAKIRVKYLVHARDLYLFQCYTGLSYKDLATLDFRTCIEERGDRLVIVARREKTNKPYYIVLMRPAVDILERYDYILSVPALQTYNRFIKMLATACNIDKDLTSHTARHTFAVFALNNGTPIEVVSKILGHTNIRTTQIYAKIVDKTIEAEFDRLEELF